MQWYYLVTRESLLNEYLLGSRVTYAYVCIMH